MIDTALEKEAMTDDMVERVARALASDHICAWESLPCSSREQYLREARAVIAAMREPTEAMVLAASREVVSEAKWRAMVDAALTASEKPPG